jgi:glycosyltransferase involved in cell wall biosynthesis
MTKRRITDNLPSLIKFEGEVERSLRIALCIWMFKPGTGGLQAHAQNLARKLIANGHEVTVITRAYTHVPEGLEYLAWAESELEGMVNGIPVRVLDYGPAMRMCAKSLAYLCHHRHFWKLGLAMFRFLARPSHPAFIGYDLIHYVGQAEQLIGFAAADAAAACGVPFVVQPTCHPFVVGDSPMDIALFQRARRAMVHTRYERDHLAPYLPVLPFDVVGNGIEDRTDGDGIRFRQTYSITGQMILYIGRRESDKGYPLVVEAFQILRRKRKDVTLVCMGPPGGTPRMEGPGIHHFDFADEQTKHDALAACTCLCVPSEGESFGLVYMEAGRYAKPVIARQLPVLEELLDGGKAGLLVGTMDATRNRNDLTAELLAESMLKLLEDKAASERLGEACRTVSQNFIWENVVRLFESSYQRAVDR